MRCVQDTDQNHHLPILHFPDAHFDLRDLAAADVSSRDLQLFRPFALRPTVGISEPPDRPAHNVLKLHATGTDSEIAPAAPIGLKK